MRSMLISLILFCSLTQLAIADGPPPVALVPNHPSLKGCGYEPDDVYQCFVPEICTVAANTGKPLSEGDVKKVKADTPISADCPALIRFFQYTYKRVLVLIESFREESEVKSIKFLQKDFDQRTKNIFSCEAGVTPTDPEIIQRGKYFDVIKFEEEELEPGEERATNLKLKCTFEAKIKQERDKILGGEDNDQIVFTVCKDAICTSTKLRPDNREHKLEDKKKCDPSLLVFNNDKDENNAAVMIQKVEYTPDGIFCKGSEGVKYELTYRKPPSGNEKTKYEPTELTCKNRGYYIGPTRMGPEEKLKVRCAAEVKYMCNYDVKKKGGKPVGPKRTEGNQVSAVVSKLECEGNNKYFFIDGVKGHTESPKFECKYFGGKEPVWTVALKDGATKILTSEGPEMYCTDKVVCHEQYTLSDSAVLKGKLGPDHLPVCFEDGTLKVNGKKVMSQKCNEQTGKFMYTDADGEHDITQGTKFTCDYPIKANEAKNRENVKKIATGAATITGGFIGFIALVVASFFLWTYLRIRRNRKRAEAINRIAWLKYCATPDEKEAEQKRVAKLRKNKNHQPSSSDGEPVQDWTWNSMMMYLQNVALRSLIEDGDTCEVNYRDHYIKMPRVNAKGQVIDMAAIPAYKPKENKIKATNKGSRSTRGTVLDACPRNYERAGKCEEEVRKKRREAATAKKLAKKKSQ